MKENSKIGVAAADCPMTELWVQRVKLLKGSKERKGEKRRRGLQKAKKAPRADMYTHL